LHFFIRTIECCQYKFEKETVLEKWSVVVVGGGAAGLMAAIAASEQGSSVLLLEKRKRPGRKLCITGGGRCNLSNTAAVSEFIEAFGRQGRFLRQAFARFFTEDLVQLMKSIGVPTVVERESYIYPKSGSASDVVNRLLVKCEQLGVKIFSECEAGGIEVSEGRVKAVLLDDKRSVECDSVVVATGGVSYRVTGSTGDGFKFAEAVGHTVIPPLPALVPLVTTESTSNLEGLTLRNLPLTLRLDGKEGVEVRGDLLFTSFGLTGPGVHNISHHASKALSEGKNVEISINLKPELSYDELDSWLIGELNNHGKMRFGNFLKKIIPPKMVQSILQLIKVEPGIHCCQIDGKMRRKLGAAIKDFSFKIAGTLPMDEAMVTAGGVVLSEVYPKTMESKLVKGLYFAGELLNLHGDSGGFNLMAAFSTGHLAGRSASEKH
jgi:predicted Rossmann fold flavoprotein